MFALLAVLSCAPEVLELRATPDASGLRFESGAPVERVALRDPSGQLVLERRYRAPVRGDALRFAPRPGVWTLHAVAGEQSVAIDLAIADPGPYAVRIEAPLGQDPWPDGEPIDVPPGGSVIVGLVVEAHRDGPIAWTTPDGAGVFALAAGERAVLPIRVAERPLSVGLDGHDLRREIELVPRPATPAGLRVGPIHVPARPDGTRDPTLPAGRIALPARWWEHTLDALGLGFRARDDLAPRTHVGVCVENTGARPANLILTLRALTPDGDPDPALRPRLRDAEVDAVRRLIRVDPGRSVDAGLPLYLDRAAVDGLRRAELVLEVRPLGAEQALDVVRAPLVIRRGTPWASAWLGIGAVASGFGWLAVGLGLPAWLRRPTRDLTRIAMFGSLFFAVGAASQVLGFGLATLLGPFAPFVLGLVDHSARACLLGALLALSPRVGTFALASLIGWLMRALALGAVHPVDAIYLGGTVFWTEGLLWLTGITRDPRWLDEGPARRFARLAGALALANGVQVGVALAISAVVYRLYYADGYVAAMIVGPGVLYAAIGCALAVPFADAVRRAA